MDVSEVKKLDAYLSKLFGNPNIRVVPKKGDVAEVFIGEDDLGELTVDDEDGDRSFNFRMVIQVSNDPSFQPVPALTDLSARQVRQREYPCRDAAEENGFAWKPISATNFSACCLLENEKGRRSYIFELPILDVDLDGGPVVVDD